MDEWKFTKKIEDMTPEETKERIRAGYEYKMPKIMQMPYLGIEEEVIYSTDDFSAKCPATGLVDVYSLVIKFTPDKNIPELKSLKLYFNEFQNLPISHEHLGSKLFEEFDSQVKPKTLELKLIAAVRGGIVTEVNLKKWRSKTK